MYSFIDYSTILFLEFLEFNVHQCLDIELYHDIMIYDRHFNIMIQFKIL